MAQIKNGSSFLDGRKIPKSVNGQYADNSGNIQIETFSSTEDIGNNPVTFTEAETRENIQTGESASTLFGKIRKWFTDLKALAFKDKVSSSDLDSTLSTTINNKVDKEEGKGLSTNDFTDELYGKLNEIPSNAEANVQSDWNETVITSDAYIKNKPTSLSDFINDSGYITSASLIASNISNTQISGLSSTNVQNSLAELSSRATSLDTRITSTTSDVEDILDGTTEVPYATRATSASSANNSTTLNGYNFSYVMNYNNLTNKPDVVTYNRYTTSISSSSWSSSAPYTKTVSLPGMLSTD